MKDIMTKREWKKSRRTKAILALVVAIVGLIMLVCSFLQDGPAALFNGPSFLVGIGLLTLGAISLLVLSDQTYESYKIDALH